MIPLPTNELATMHEAFVAYAKLTESGMNVEIVRNSKATYDVIEANSILEWLICCFDKKESISPEEIAAYFENDFQKSMEAETRFQLHDHPPVVSAIKKLGKEMNAPNITTAVDKALINLESIYNKKIDIMRGEMDRMHLAEKHSPATSQITLPHHR